MGDYIGEYSGLFKGDTRSLDSSSCDLWVESWGSRVLVVGLALLFVLHRPGRSPRRREG